MGQALKWVEPAAARSLLDGKARDAEAALVRRVPPFPGRSTRRSSAGRWLRRPSYAYPRNPCRTSQMAGPRRRHRSEVSSPSPITNHFRCLINRPSSSSFRAPGPMRLATTRSAPASKSGRNFKTSEGSMHALRMEHDEGVGRAPAERGDVGAVVRGQVLRVAQGCHASADTRTCRPCSRHRSRRLPRN